MPGCKLTLRAGSGGAGNHKSGSVKLPHKVDIAKRKNNRLSPAFCSTDHQREHEIDFLSWDFQTESKGFLVGESTIEHGKYVPGSIKNWDKDGNEIK